jgi:Raf kinase inhibitor-like YbhB/YbcL family protein
MNGKAWLIALALASVAQAQPGGGKMAITVKSPAFAANGEIPKQYTCQGKDVSPPILWAGLPAGTKSVALIVDDPDAPDPKAPKLTWVHWVVFDIPATAKGIGEGERGGKEGLNDWKRAGWGGPCPPVGRHRYFFKVYALDTTIDLDRPTKAVLEAAMAGHVLGRGELIGTYEKK